MRSQLRDVAVYARDLADRVVWTYLQAVLGLAAANGFDLLSLSAWHTAAVAGLPAVVALVKGVLAGFVNDPDTATFLRTRAVDAPQGNSATSS